MTILKTFSILTKTQISFNEQATGNDYATEYLKYVSEHLKDYDIVIELYLNDPICL